MPLQNWATPIKLYELEDLIKKINSKYVPSYGDKIKFFKFIKDKIKSKGKDYLHKDMIKDLRDDIRNWEENKKSYDKYLKFFEEEVLGKL